MNLYSYVGQNPINQIDPSGMNPISCKMNGDEAIDKCGKDAEKARNLVENLLDQCEKDFEKCQTGETQEKDSCDEFEQTGGMSVARLRCWNRIVDLVSVADKTLSIDCIKSAAKAVKSCSWFFKK